MRGEGQKRSRENKIFNIYFGAVFFMRIIIYEYMYVFD